MLRVWKLDNHPTKSKFSSYKNPLPFESQGQPRWTSQLNSLFINYSWVSNISELRGEKRKEEYVNFNRLLKKFKIFSFSFDDNGKNVLNIYLYHSHFLHS